MTTTTSPDILEEARRLFEAGVPLLPCDPVDKYPSGFGGWQKGGFTWAQIESHVTNGGALGDLQGVDREGVDLDSKHWIGDPAELRDGYEQMVEDNAPGLLARLVIVSTPSGGRHYRYRCSGAVEGNQKLAERPQTDEEFAANPKGKAVTLIETRGQGGQFMIPPSPGYEVLRGDLADIPEITPDERSILLACARAFNQVAAKVVTGEPKTHRGKAQGDSRPGDHYNQNGGIDEALDLLERDGWSVASFRGSTAYLRRPGKDRGVSATYGHVAPGIFYCFTSNGSPFDPNTSYTPFAVRALLAHDGDYGAAAKALAERYEMPYYPEGEPVDQDGALCCPKHKRPLRAANRGGGWFHCTAKAGEAFCTYSARIPDYTPPSATETAQEAQAQDAPAQELGPTAKLAHALRKAGYQCELNTETGDILVNGEVLEDVQARLLRAAVRDKKLGKVTILEDALAVAADQHRVAPIRDGLAALEWDGKPHIAQLAACLRTASEDVIRYEDGTTRRAAYAFLLRWMLGSVGRVSAGDQNAMLVFDGPQGIGKSSLARWLGTVLPGVYCEESIAPQDKDCLMRLTRTLVWEAGEIDASTRKHDAAALKHFLTRATVTTRPAYGRRDVTRPVLASFIGTVNTSGNGFLPDATGNRRYLVLTLTGLDWDYQKMDARQVWAEAVARYQKGERGTLTKEEAAYRDRMNAEHYQSTGLMDDWLLMHFEITQDSTELLTSGEIAEHLTLHRINLGGNDRAQAMAIAEALTRAGLTRAERRACLAHYGDFRRAWAGIRLRLCPICDPTSSDDPTLIQPRPKVGSSRPNAAHGYDDPTDPTSSTINTKNGVSAGGGNALRTAVRVASDEKTGSIDDPRGSVGLDARAAHQDEVIQPSGQVGSGWIGVGSDDELFDDEPAHSAPPFGVEVRYSKAVKKWVAWFGGTQWLGQADTEAEAIALAWAHYEETRQPAAD